MVERKLRSGKKVRLSEDGSGGSVHDSEAERTDRLNAREAMLLAMEDLTPGPSERRETRSRAAKGKRSTTYAEDPKDNASEASSGPRSGSTRTSRVAKRPTRSQTSSVTSKEKSEDEQSANESDEGVESEKVETIPGTDGQPAKKKPIRKQRKMLMRGFQRAEGISEKSLEVDRKKRLEYLLKQSELFANMMTSGGTESCGRKSKKGKMIEEMSSSQQSTDHRHARKESDDDEAAELLSAEIKAIPRFEKTPFYIANGEMRDYQVRGLNWMISLCENSINGILADEMGLGKTLQTISLLGYYLHVKKSNLPHLVIVPKSTLSNWNNEFKRWCPTVEPALLKGDQEDRNKFMAETRDDRNWDVLITSYEIAMREQAFIKKFTWGYIVVDEAHRIKNESAMLSRAVRKFKSHRRLLLTGTPLQNNLHELWSLLNFLLPDVFEDASDFDSWFDEQAAVTDISLVERLHTILRPFLLRRVKADVEKNLPPKTEVKLFVGLTEMQRKWYRQLLMKDVSLLNTTHGSAVSSLQNILMHLRKCCNHPYLFEGAEPGPPYTTDIHIVDNCGKMILLHKLLRRLKDDGHRVLIFSQMTRVLDILEDYCIWTGYNHCRLDGSTPHEEREEYIRDFNAPGSNKFVFLLSTRAGGLGINLTSADTVILYDSDWNPQVDLQAMDRVHRIGQTKPVTVFRLVTENTVEERITERAERKKRLDALVIQSGRLVDSSKKLNKDEILKMIRHGAQGIIHSDITNITDEDIDTILTKGKAKTEEMNKKMETLSEDNLKVFSNDFADKEFTVYKWEGEDYRDQHGGKDVDNQWIALPKRERKQIYDLSGTGAGGGSSSRDSPPWTPKLLNKPVKRPSIPRPPVYRFIDIHFASPRLTQLLEQEQTYYKKASEYTVFTHADLPEDVKLRKQEEQAAIYNAVPLTSAEEAEKFKLLKETFYNWKRVDVATLLRGLETYGPDNPGKILVPGKTSREVLEYLSAFLNKYEVLPDAARIKMRIQKGVSNQDKQKRRREVIKAKIEASTYPEYDLKIPYPSGHKSQGLLNNGNARVVWYEEEDRFLLCAYVSAAEIFADDNEEMYDHIRDTIRTSPRFLFDYVMRSITTERVKERLDTLLTWFVRDAMPSTPKLIPAQKASQTASGSSPSTARTPATPDLTSIHSKLTGKGSSTKGPSGSPSSSEPGTARSYTLKAVDSGAGKFLLQPQEITISSSPGSSPKKASGSGGVSFKVFSDAGKPNMTIASASKSSPGSSRVSPSKVPSGTTQTIVTKKTPVSVGKPKTSASKIPLWALGGSLASATKDSGSSAKRSAPENSGSSAKRSAAESDSDSDVEVVYQGAVKPRN